MKTVYGHTKGLKKSRIKQLENLYRRRVRPEAIITYELSKDMARLSFDMGRQIGVLINRLGKIAYVVVGDSKSILLPNLEQYRIAPGRLRGVRCIHTHIGPAPLSNDDLTDLALLRLDMMAAVSIKENGTPDKIHAAHILPTGKSDMPYEIMAPIEPFEPDIGCLELVMALEDEISRQKKAATALSGAERAILVSVFTGSRKKAKDSLDELKELAKTAGIDPIHTVFQQRQQIDPRLFMGSGKLSELAILTLHKNATLIIFNQELNPSQTRSITDAIELKVIDRTQLILDIFARRAKTSEGKILVELAQLKYLLPRLVFKNTAMSRLTGGIGGRGPGETKLEINRRRVRERITRLEKASTQVQKQRSLQRGKRDKKGLPVISIIGYTNAGKSTLLNTLTKSRVLAENKLFATLDPSSRRLRLPRDAQVIITDTVGFIRDLPKDLLSAFKATLEELEDADLLLHVIDLSNPRHKEQVKSVDRILSDLGLSRIPCLRVLNKIDRIGPKDLFSARRTLKGIAVSAKDRKTFPDLLAEIEATVKNNRNIL